MSFEKIGDSLSQKNLDAQFDIVRFFTIVKEIIKRRSGVTIDSVSFNDGLLRITVGHPVEASEIRMRKIQIERELVKRTGQKIDKIFIRVSG